MYALPAETVAEVIRIPSTARVPQAPRALVGVANLRGVVLPVVSLRALLGLEGEPGVASRAIVLDGAAPVAIVVDAIDALVTIDAERIETRSAQLSVERGERLSGAFPLGDGQGAAKILDVQALLAETFARRARPDTSSALRVVVATHAPEAAAEARETFVTFDVAGQEFALDLGLVQEIIALPGAIAAAPRVDKTVAGMMAFREQLLPLVSLRELLGFARCPHFGSARKGHRRVRWRRAGRSHRRSRARRHLRRPGADRSGAAYDSGPFGWRGSHQIDLSRRGRPTAGLDP